MFKLKELVIKNAKGYEEVTIPLDNQGAVAINGVNGAGKSTIWDVLQSILFVSTPGGHKKDELTKDFKDSHHGVKFSFGGDEYSVVHQRVKKKWSYLIEKNGVDITPHNYNDCAKLLKTLVPLTREEFGGSIHLTQGGQHVLIEGAPRDRNQYISRLFGLDDNGEWGRVQLATTQELAKVTSRLAEMDRLEASRQMVLKTLADHPDQKDLLTQAQNNLGLVQNSIKEWEAYRQQVLATARVLDEHERLKSHKEAEPQARLRLVQVNAESAALSEELGGIGALVRANQRAREHNQKGALARSQLQALIKENPALLELDLVELEALRLKVSTYDRLRPLLLEMKMLSEAPDTLVDLIPGEDTLAELTSWLTLARNRYEAIKRGSCPTCGSEHPATEIATLAEEIQAKSAAQAQWQNWLVESRKANALATKKASLKSVLPQEGVLEPTTEELSRLVTLNLAATKKEQYDRLRTAVDSFSDLEILPEPGVEPLRRNQEDLALEKGRLESTLRMAAQCPDAPPMTKESCDLALSQSTEQLAAAQSAAQAYQEQVGWYRSSQNVRSKAEAELAQLETKLGDLPHWLREKKFWEKMGQAYGNKGLRLTRLRDIMDAVIRRLPYFMGLLSSERGLAFSCNVDYDGIEILAQRSYLSEAGKEVTFTHDVSGFSGGEKKRLSVALIFALASCVPAKKKSNLVVLDEIDANLDAEGRFRFVNDLLPALKEDYESIFVISHAEEVRMAAIYDSVWRVEKKNHKSTLTFTN